jgi:hypothetical protein
VADAARAVEGHQRLGVGLVGGQTSHDHAWEMIGVLDEQAAALQAAAHSGFVVDMDNLFELGAIADAPPAQPVDGFGNRQFQIDHCRQRTAKLVEHGVERLSLGACARKAVEQETFIVRQRRQPGANRHGDQFVVDKLAAREHIAHLESNRRAGSDLLAQHLVGRHGDNRPVAHGLIHGDLSAYNILYWEGRITLIDFPQVTYAASNRNARAIFERDVRRVCEYFLAQGVQVEPSHMAAELWERHVESSPDDTMPLGVG